MRHGWERILLLSAGLVIDSVEKLQGVHRSGGQQACAKWAIRCKKDARPRMVRVFLAPCRQHGTPVALGRLQERDVEIYGMDVEASRDLWRRRWRQASGAPYGFAEG
ncbi:hypothetical protein B0T19DRAFT_399224 [Cercophora scortea]|uniref:Uncharacterized protein n=1 Tax=Cercophora scortea TaxID=314031 RepID=A0AAE0IYG1_9PEZI|nr:hypothetical protein B0T19DRAFT_399224 [Cercophora scortea]